MMRSLDRAYVMIAGALPPLACRNVKALYRRSAASDPFSFPSGCNLSDLVASVFAHRNSLVESLPSLDDRLVEHLPIGTVTPAELHELCTREMSIAAALAPIAANSAGWLDAALIIARSAYDFEDLTARDVAVQTYAAADQLSYGYPDPKVIRSIISAAEQNIDRLRDDVHALGAGVGYASTIHAHPFRDGNKRTARILWAMIARQNLRPVIPMALLTNVNRPAYALKMRRLHLLGEWEPLLAYLLAAAQAVQLIAARCIRN